MGISFALMTGLEALQEHSYLKTFSGWGVLCLEVLFLLLYFVLYAYILSYSRLSFIFLFYIPCTLGLCLLSLLLVYHSNIE